MKILGTLFRILCALIVLLAAAVYLDGPFQVSILDYLGDFTPEHILSFATFESWLAIAVGALLLLTLCCGLKLGWNLVYSLATLLFFAEVALLALGPDMALPTATRGLGWEQPLRELFLNYPVPALMIPALCVLGCLCTTAPVRIAWTSLVSCALTYGCAELLAWGAQSWLAMPEPVLPQAQELIRTFPWLLAAIPAIFFLQYSLFMAMFETFMPRRKKAAAEKKKAEEVKAQETPAEEKKETLVTEEKTDASPAAPKLPGVAPVVVKRPVIHRKSPISPVPAPAPAKKEEASAEEEKAEPPAPEAEASAAPAAREEAPAAAEATGKTDAKEEEAPAPAPEVKEEPPAEEEKKAEEKPAATPAE